MVRIEKLATTPSAVVVVGGMDRTGNASRFHPGKTLRGLLLSRLEKQRSKRQSLARFSEEPMLVGIMDCRTVSTPIVLRGAIQPHFDDARKDTEQSTCSVVPVVDRINLTRNKAG